MPLTLGCEMSGTVAETGSRASGFKPGEKVYATLPLDRIGAFAEYVVVNTSFLSPMPEGYSFATAAAIPLTGLTAMQALQDEFHAEPGSSLLITGGSGSFGEMAVPIAKTLGIHATVSGNERAEARMRELGASQYINYKEKNYWELDEKYDNVVDTLGLQEFNHELSVLKPGGCLLSLRGIPNRAFALAHRLSWPKRLLFSLAGARLDRQAKNQSKTYRFFFVRADGQQLRTLTRIVENYQIRPKTVSRVFRLDQTEEALRCLAQGHTDGKVIIEP